MSELEKAARQALEALVEDRAWLESDAPQAVWDKNNQANTALRRALEQPAQQEPVARVVGYYAGRCVIEPLDPAAVMPNNMALYTRPQAREPLTDEQIHDIYDEVARREPYNMAVTRRNIARAIEAAHGIGGKA